MSKRLKSLEEHDIIIESMRNYQGGEANDRERMLMKRFIYTAMKIELTDKQRYCITQYYLNEKSMSEIAKELSLNPSTVSFHIKRAKAKIKKRTGYVDTKA